jgi:hypothetical protein
MYPIGSSSAKRSATNSQGLQSGGKHSARKLKRAQVLLAANAGVATKRSRPASGMGGSTVPRTKRRLAAGRGEAAREPRPGPSVRSPAKNKLCGPQRRARGPREGRAVGPRSYRRARCLAFGLSENA